MRNSDQKMEILDQNRIYFSALYDFAYLEKHFIKSLEYRHSFSVSWDIVEDGVSDIITDTVPMPDLFHHLQFSHSFIEKFLKYYISIVDSKTTLEQMLKFSHNIPDLLKHLNEIKPDWNAKIGKNEWELLLIISKINFPKLRYVQPQPQSFTVNFQSLKILLIEIYEHLKTIRFNNTSSISQEKQNNRKIGRIFGYIEKKVAPGKFGNEHFERIIRTENLLPEQKELISKSYKITESEILLQADENNQDLIAALETAEVDVWDYGEIRFDIT